MKNRMYVKDITALTGLSSRGFTLLEVLVVMSIFMVVIIISSQAFDKILTASKQLMKSSESDTQGIIGLEMLRRDLEHAGYGLPWLLSFPAEIEEATTETIAPGIDSRQFNDKNSAASATDPNKVPRALQAAASTTTGRDYLVIKSILAGMSDTNKKWAYIQGVGAASTFKTWGGGTDFVADERVVTIDSRTKNLVAVNPPANGTSYTSATAADFSYLVTQPNMMPPAAFQPLSDTDVFLVYGVSPASSTSALRAPYNRVDYYIKRPAETGDMPSRCAPGTGILYKGVMLHGTSGGFTQYPLVECIADMQVVFNVAADGVNGVDVAQNGLAGLSAKEIRQQLKMIKIYIVAHEGGKDMGFNYANQTLTVGEGGGRILDLKNDVVGSDQYKNYRWKTYKLIVVPKNINY